MLNFLKYNNLVPIVLGVAFLGSGAAFAADPQAIYSSQSQVVSVDNTYIANKDLSTYKPQVEIIGVTEDLDNYYVVYAFSTIDVVNYVWQDVVKNETMAVSKADLGPRDLGVYVTGQLRNVTQNEIAYLTQVQQKARGSISQKVVATTYGGLVGKFLDPTTETLPGYTPVVVPPADGNPSNSSNSAAVSEGGTTQSGSSSNTPGGSNQIGIQVLGNNPSILALHATFIDLGAVLLDPQQTNVGIHTLLDGVETTSPTIDTSISGIHIIEYRATDRTGNTIVARRVVLVGGAADPGGEVSAVGVTTIPQQVPVQQTQPVPTSTPQTSIPQTSAPQTTGTTTSAIQDTAQPQSTSASTTQGDAATSTAHAAVDTQLATTTPPAPASQSAQSTTTASTTAI